ncbi:hypothetical protein BGX21_008584 [Mortierella sp. AD011]|nr:hypothetical protein BGX20_008455 [Mortierella sp. AD010]KAF9397711.1 hypothetical protein BGX21_008584 [Mortierella sp. AD011]
MVNIQHWDEFQKAAEELYMLAPNSVLKYKTDQMQDLNKFERLNRSLMAKMHNRIPAPVAETPTPASAPSASASAPAQPAATATISSPSTQQGGGGKKKNRRK